MIERTPIQFQGCQIWLESEKKRELKKTVARFKTWIKTIESKHFKEIEECSFKEPDRQTPQT